MITKIGVNIITTTAKEQEYLIRDREPVLYYQEPYQSLRPHAEKIIKKYTDADFEIEAQTSLKKNGDVINSIIFVFNNKRGVEKKLIKTALKNYLHRRYKRIFAN